ncbi:MAG TPA: DinB family protein [Chitinophagaceae bacterium]|nr:DinB family protein [Chitinophagaceae bacterium]
MNTEMLQIAEQLKDTYEGAPWFGKNGKTLLAEAEAVNVFENPNGQHSIIELLYHMITWREFTISRLRHNGEKTTAYFEARDWQPFEASDTAAWHAGLKKLAAVQNELADVLQQQQDALLIETVPERSYTFRNLLYGIVQHDIYHLGQVAYITKLLKG